MWEKLLKGLKESPSSPVIVNLSHNHVTSSGVKSILAVLKEKPSVEAIILQDSRLGDEEISELTDGITRLLVENVKLDP
ncbi:unnamed protein product [Candidula unifasciata]|uniref:Uncharacterized protein n=1 Tax=Candidula unifasciata TaxID=100452 RepID=A0A8S4A8F0_9EUPU|nr:unnamed protein product [Candidula unifasciata]